MTSNVVSTGLKKNRKLKNDKMKKSILILCVLLTGVFTHLNPETLMGITSTMVHTTDSSAAIAVIGGADGPTAIFVTGDLQSLWGMVVKVFSNVLVIVLNYVFSKLIIFKKK